MSHINDDQLPATLQDLPRQYSREPSPQPNRVIVAPVQTFSDTASLHSTQPPLMLVQSGHGPQMVMMNQQHQQQPQYVQQGSVVMQQQGGSVHGSVHGSQIMQQPAIVMDDSGSHYSYTHGSLSGANIGIIQGAHSLKRDPSRERSIEHSADGKKEEEDGDDDDDIGDLKTTEVSMDEDDDLQTVEISVGTPKDDDGRDFWMRFTDRRYQNPRISLIIIFFTDIFSNALLYGDLLVSLLVCQRLFSESWGGTVVLMGCIISGPFWISWGSVLAFMEQLMVENPGLGSYIRVMSGPYLFPPIGMLFLFFLEMIFLVWKISKHFYNFCCNPSRFTEAAFDSRFSSAYPRFRQITHAIGHSLVLFVYLIWVRVYYSDDLEDDDRNLIYLSMCLSFLNFFCTFMKIFYKRKQLRVRMWEYILMSLNLSSGYVPQLAAIKDGSCKTVDWSRSRFGHYTYSVVVDALQSQELQLSEVLLSTFTLRNISPILCFQLGHTFKTNDCTVKFIKHGVRETWMEFDKDNKGEVEWEYFEKTARELFGQHPDEAVDEAIKCAKDKVVSQNTVYYSDFVHLIAQPTFLSMLIIGNPTLFAISKHEGAEDLQADPEAIRLLEFMDGLDQISLEDPKSGETALYHTLVEQDEELIKELQDRGAMTGEADGRKMGGLAVQIMKASKLAKEDDDLSEMRGKQNELEKFFLLVHTYDCFDWDPSFWKDDVGNNLLHHCAMHGTVGIAKILLTVPRMASDCLPAQNENGKTPLNCANDKEIIGCLKENLDEYEHADLQAMNQGYASSHQGYYMQQQQLQQGFLPQMGMQ